MECELECECVCACVACENNDVYVCVWGVKIEHLAQTVIHTIFC